MMGTSTISPNNSNKMRSPLELRVVPSNESNDVQEGGYFVPPFPSTKNTQKLQLGLESWFIQLTTCETFDKTELFNWMRSAKQSTHKSRTLSDKDRKQYLNEFSQRLVSGFSGASDALDLQGAPATTKRRKTPKSTTNISESIHIINDCKNNSVDESSSRSSPRGIITQIATNLVPMVTRSNTTNDQTPSTLLVERAKSSPPPGSRRYKKRSSDTTTTSSSEIIGMTSSDNDGSTEKDSSPVIAFLQNRRRATGPERVGKTVPSLKCVTDGQNSSPLLFPQPKQQSARRSSVDESKEYHQTVAMVDLCHRIFRDEYNITTMTHKVLNLLYKFTKAKALYLMRNVPEKAELLVEAVRERKSDPLRCLQSEKLLYHEDNIYKEYIDHTRNTLEVARAGSKFKPCTLLSSSIENTCTSSYDVIICLPIQSQGTLQGILYLASDNSQAFDNIEVSSISIILTLLMTHLSRHFAEKTITKPKLESLQITQAHQSPSIMQDSLLKYDALTEQWSQVFLVLNQGNLKVFSSPYDTNPRVLIKMEDIREIEIYCEKKFTKNKPNIQEPKMSKNIRLQCSLFYMTLNNGTILWFANTSLCVVFKWVKQVGNIVRLFADNNNNYRLPSDIRFDSKQLVVGKLLGQGGEASVYQASWNNITVALKKMHDYGDSESVFLKEISMLRRLRHPNIVCLFGGFYDDANRPCIVTEFASMGSLDNVLHDESVEMSDSVKLSVIRQTAAALTYMHSLDIPVVHRDLKPANILITTDWVVKLADFGLAQNYSTVSEPRQGTVKWVAPEIFDGAEYTTKADIYSFALICWEIITRQPFFSDVKFDVDLEKQVKKGRRPDLPDCHPNLRKLMKACWAAVPHSRPSTSEVTATLGELTTISS